ncbi:MAG: 50S ribosomal protein L24 [Candidatus Amoebophilus sp. 36-38]|nr:MAG: 50S ribosomal protein L24 [Candidatus Amoebophilus sp. 36-38]
MYHTHHKTSKFHIKKGDTVQVLSGNYQKKQGKVLKVFTKTYRAIVEGVNFVSKHRKPTAKNPQGAIERVEAPIHMSNLMLIDPATGKPTRVGRKLNGEGKLQRYSKKTGEFINNG